MTDAVLADWRTAPVTPRLRAMLGFLERMAHTPYRLGVDEAEELRAAGVSEQAATDAIQVAYCFHIIDRIADAVGFHIPEPAAFEAGARHLLKRGYK